MSDLKDKLIKLGSENPELRDDLRKVISFVDKEAEAPSESVKDEIKDELHSIVKRLDESKYGPGKIQEFGNRLDGIYRNRSIHKEFDRQDRRNIKKQKKKGEEKVKRALSRYDEYIKSIEVRSSDKNYLKVRVYLKEE